MTYTSIMRQVRHWRSFPYVLCP